jgi:hypothetical protein
MPMTPGDAVARALDMISTIATLTDGLAQRNAAQASYYIASLHEVGLLSPSQFEELTASAASALRDWEVEHATHIAMARG